MSRLSRWTCVAVFGLLAHSVCAAVPGRISYQGRMVDGSGNSVADGQYSVLFTIYDNAIGGASKWSETQTVTTKQGLFSAALGSVTPISDSVFSASTRYLGLRLGANPEMTPRTAIISVPFAMRTATIDGASGGTLSGGLSVGSGHASTGTNGLVVGTSHSLSGPTSSICGGVLNEVSGGSSVIGGGQGNRVTGSLSAIGGGVDNEATGRSSAIGGGDTNTIYGGGYAGTIAGGRHNQIWDTGGTVGGGSGNSALGRYSVVAGGGRNKASGRYALVAGGGGANASDSNLASGLSSAVGGGARNVASGDWSMVAGGLSNYAAGSFSFAAGKNARALHSQCFVWNGGDFIQETTSDREFIVVAEGGIIFHLSPLTVTEEAGSFTEVSKGEYYRDNSIVAWGKVSGAGSIAGNEFGVSSVVRNNPGNYSVFLDAAASESGSLIAVANAELDAAPNSAATVRIVAINQISTTEFRVYITNGSFAPTDNDFVFLVTAR